MVSAESLTSEQQLTVKRYMAMSGLQGVVLGAFVAPSTWDIRPLLLSEGLLYILRFSDPAIGLQKSRLSFLRATCEKIQQSLEPKAIAGFGESEGQVWVQRRFFPSTVAEDNAGTSGIHPLQFAQKLIRAVIALHRSSLIHGHICPNNVAVESQEVFLLDHSFRVSLLPQGREVSTLAPELKLSVIPTYAADVYGLGLVLKACAISELGAEQQLCIDRMLSSDPGNRPALDVVKENFMPHEAQQAKPATVSIMTPAAQGLTAGKLVPKSASQPDIASPLRTEGPPRIIVTNAPIISPQQVPEWKRPEAIVPPSMSDRAGSSNSEAAPVINKTSSSSGLLALLFAFAVLLVGYFYLGKGGTEIDPAMLAAAWSSNQPSRMQQVADAAVRGNADAQLIIVSDALRGQTRPLVRTSLLRMGFDSNWEKDLAASDRKILLSLALVKLLSDQRLSLPPLSEAHPAVALAIAGDTPDLNQSQGNAELAAVPISKLALLNAPYGEMFSLLERGGIKNLGDLPARGLAHIVAGDTSPLALQSYFSSGDSRETALLKLAILFPLARRVPTVEDAIFSTLSTQAGPLNEAFVWFASEDLAQWTKTSRIDLLALVAGELPATELSVEQYADLLRFPDPAIREKARVKALERYFSPKLASTLTVLSSPAVRLSRFQVISLVSALQLQGEASYALLGSVMETNPDPRAILMLLLARASAERIDPINVEFARYVTRMNPKLSLEELKKMSVHPEQLARAFAYANLSEKDPQQREILAAAAVVEPSERLRKQIAEKLKGVVVDVPVPASSAEDRSTPSATPKAVSPKEEDLDLDPF